MRTHKEIMAKGDTLQIDSAALNGTAVDAKRLAGLIEDHKKQTLEDFEKLHTDRDIKLDDERACGTANKANIDAINEIIKSTPA